ncbi:AAA family ATPase [Simplicispira metamorpha]|uniref:AAA domain-containing protein n=1 Tax=Simplicispira metamorpha TaxID=80881 RepID=A0A4R2MW83_9BURK|nr:AAA family ATPase [Simplicispira metamorpha]TCP10647.1 AAA domain-containing protein [Simplicispira metamorpha]
MNPDDYNRMVAELDADIAARPVRPLLDLDAINAIASGAGKTSAGAGFEPLPEPATERTPDSVVLACGADLTPEPVRWLWRHWLALGKLHILAGAPGQGKTTIAMAMAATDHHRRALARWHTLRGGQRAGLVRRGRSRRYAGAAPDGCRGRPQPLPFHPRHSPRW